MIKYVVTRSLAYYKEDSSWLYYFSNSTCNYRRNIMAYSILLFKVNPINHYLKYSYESRKRNYPKNYKRWIN